VQILTKLDRNPNPPRAARAPPPPVLCRSTCEACQQQARAGLLLVACARACAFLGLCNPDKKGHFRSSFLVKICTSCADGKSACVKFSTTVQGCRDPKSNNAYREACPRTEPFDHICQNLAGWPHRKIFSVSYYTIL